ncbi:MAG: peptide/nickel transport system substrate-binding protein [Thermomicrobiales bacterium]|nr:peptide/nickel transport system substrate-binding protein [Thermomicrobiales bacterium]MEA2530248.1 peptide/nickel transport system substrate-binding protein [Thermomicrobiales bacterium]
MSDNIGPRNGLKSLVDEYRQAGLSRREFVKRAAVLGLSAPAAASLLAAATPRLAMAQETPQQGGRFTEGYDRDFTKMDPVNSGWADPGYNAIYEYVMLRDANGAIVPCLAESWTISDDNLSWTFKIRDGLKFHSGAACTNANVVEDFNLFRSAEGGGQNAIFWNAVTDVTAGDGNTVVVKLSKPFAAFPETLATEYSMIHNQAARAEAGDQYGATTEDGTGPFTLGEFTPGNQVLFKKWADYPGSIVPFLENKGPAYIDELRFVPILEVANRANELEAGGVDAIKNPAPQDLDRLTSNPDVVVMEWANPANLFINLNDQKTELGFDDIRVRQAISHAIDRQGLADAIYFGHAIATYGPIPSNWKWYEPGVEQFNQFDLEKAKSLLEEAGWTVGSDGIREKNGVKLSFTLYNWGAQTYGAQINEAITGMLKDAGVEMKLVTLDTAELFPRVLDPKAEPVDAFSYEWLWSSPMDVLVIFNSIPNFPFNGDHQDLKQAFDEWQGAATDAELEAAARKAQLIWAEKLPLIPVVTGNVIWAHHKKVHGWTPTQTMLYPLYNDVWVEQ